MEVILTGEPLPAQRAYDLGLVNRLVEPGQAFEEATRLAEQICAAAPLAVWASRKVVLAVGLRGRRDAQADDQRRDSPASWPRRTPRRASPPSSRSARRTGQAASDHVGSAAGSTR